MSCVVAVVRDGKITMGADRLIASSGTAFSNTTPKIVRYGDLVVGNVHDMRTHAMLYGKDWEAPLGIRAHPDLLTAWLQRDVVSWLREEWRQAGMLTKKADGQDSLEATLLIGVKGRLFEMNEFSVAEVFEYHAIGAGRDIALGALYALEKLEILHSETAVRVALGAVERHCIYVRGPFDVVEMQP